MIHLFSDAFDKFEANDIDYFIMNLTARTFIPFIAHLFLSSSNYFFNR